MKKNILLKTLVVASLFSVALVGCGDNKPSSDSLSTDSTTSNFDHDSISTGGNDVTSVESTFIPKAVEATDIYNMITKMAETKTFHQRIFGDEAVFDFIYHNDEYISQNGGDLSYSAILLPSYKEGEDGDRAYMARYTENNGKKDYYLGEAIYMQDYTTGEIIGPETSLFDYNPMSYYDEYEVVGDELKLDTKKENTYVMRYNTLWKDNPSAFDNFYHFIGGLIEAGPMLGAGRLKKIEMSVSENNVLKIVGYINDLETDVVKPYFESEFSDIGTAKDEDLEKFLKSDAVKISKEAPTEANFANIFEDHISTDTTIYEVVDGVKSLIGENHLDYDKEHAYIYGIEGKKHFTNINGALYQDFIDGGNEVYHSPTQFKYGAINGLKYNVDVDDFRKVGENKYRYYGLNYAEVFGDLSETSVPGDWAMSNLFVELKDGKVDKYILETSVEHAVVNETGKEVEAYYILETKVVTPRNVDILAPFARNEVEASRLENALAVLNNGEVEFKVHGEEHSDDPDTNNTSIREVTYARDYVYQEYKYTKPHMDASGNPTVENILDRDGYYLKKNIVGDVIGISEFKYNYKNELIAYKPLNERKTDLDSYWYYAEPAAEIFDYDASTRTYTSKEYTGYYAAILIKKAFKTSADNFMDEVRITLNEALDKVERIEYDMVWRFSDGFETKATGRLDFTYNIDTQTLRSKLEALSDYEEPLKWSDSEKGYELTREFNDYFKGYKNALGEQLEMDMVPYLYDKTGDGGWVAVQFTIAGEIWMLNDNSVSNPNYVQELIQLFTNDFNYEYIGSYHNLGDMSFKNGQMIVSIFPNTNDGIWFTKVEK